jgi:large subunit ribosomal protein L32
VLSYTLRLSALASLRKFHHFSPPLGSVSVQEPTMAVQQNKKSPSKRGMHRSHNALVVPGIALEPTTGEVHLRHHISPTGFYRGRKVIKTKTEA